MSPSYFSDLIHGRTPDGRDLAPQDYQDALRALADQHIRYCQLGDESGMALCGGMMAAVLVARGKHGQKVVLRQGRVVGLAAGHGQPAY